MNRIDPDIIAASRARPRPQTGTRAQEGAAPASHPAPPPAPDQQGAAGQNSATLTSTTAEFQADGAP